MNGRGALFATAILLAVVACGGSETRHGDAGAGLQDPAQPTASVPTPAVQANDDETAVVFDHRSVHDVSLTVAERDLPVLVPGNDERVHAQLSFDGTVIEDVGLRLKAGVASSRPLDGKPGFSIDTNEFAKKRSLFGVTKFTLGNEVNDPSFIVETIVYDIFRSAGIVAPRTALATVRFNGEPFGLYVIREGYDKNFLKRSFANPEGNLYEGSLDVDITDVADMGLRTNEAANDRSDLAAVAAAVFRSTDDELLAAVGKQVDLDQFMTFWAVEALTDHWDGYIAPNNYYVYRDPSVGRFVFLAWGADWAMTDPTYHVFSAPGSAALMGVRLYGYWGFQEKLRARIGEVLEKYWDTPALLREADDLAALVRANGLTGTREAATIKEDFERVFAERRAFIENRAAVVKAQLAGR